MKLLVYGNRKQDDMLWDVSTNEKMDKAMLELFTYFDAEWNFYSTSELTPRESGLYERAKNGDASAARALLSLRKNYEYEEWHFSDTEEGD